jgi:hypothetical protein
VSDRISAKKTVVVRASVSVSTIFGGVFRAAKADKRENEAGWTGGGRGGSGRMRRRWGEWHVTSPMVKTLDRSVINTAIVVDQEKVKPKKSADRGCRERNWWIVETDLGRRMRKARESDATKRTIRFQCWGTGGRMGVARTGWGLRLRLALSWFGSGWLRGSEYRVQKTNDLRSWVKTARTDSLILFLSSLDSWIF